MRLEDVKVGMRVKLTDKVYELTGGALGMYGTVTDLPDPREDETAADYPVEVKFDDVTYDSPIYHSTDGTMIYDLVREDEIEPAEEGA